MVSARKRDLHMYNRAAKNKHSLPVHSYYLGTSIFTM